MASLGLGILGAALALFVGTLAEYIGHRVMHKQRFGAGHAEHHKWGLGQGVLGEFYDYARGTLPIALIFCAVCWPVGGWALSAGFFLGYLIFAAFAAYAHQLQHERPDLVFWMPMPIHYIHHRHRQWHHNFGITVDWWDRIVGTFKPVEWQRAKDITLRDLVGIAWRRPAECDLVPAGKMESDATRHFTWFAKRGRAVEPARQELRGQAK